MAQLDKYNRLIGGLGDLVFRQVNGKTIVQGKPGKNGVKQTKQTKLSSSDFGTASRTTKRLAISLRRLFLTSYDAQMFNRFRKTVYQAMLSNSKIPKGDKNLWYGEIDLLDGFEFNLSSLYTDYCSLGIHSSLTSAQEMKLETEGFDPKAHLKWPSKAQRAEICYLISTYNKDTFTPLIEEVFKISVTPFSSPIAAQSFISPPLPTNCLVLVSVCVWFFREDALTGAVAINHKALHPAKIEKVFKLEE